MMLGDLDTIAAIATARGSGALSIVRISGPQTAAIVKKCFTNSTFDPEISHQATFGLWKDPASDSPIDEVVLLNFSEGRGFTGEPSVEITCHGGMQVTELVLEALLNAGARLARPGEFTYRAVMNGRLDLTKAEGILELINARSPRAAARALEQMRGALSQKLSEMEKEIIHILANLEASIDFSTEDIQPIDLQEMTIRVRRLQSSVDELLGSYLKNRIVTRGLRVVMAGKPNGGKSSLLNKLLGKDRSIVSPTPGTTRDTVEDDLLLEGYIFRLVDTAGIRDSLEHQPIHDQERHTENHPENHIEKQGIERTLKELGAADVVVYVVDSSVGLANDDVQRIKEIGPSATIVCFNKEDLQGIRAKEILERFGLMDFRFVTSSALESDGVAEVKRALLDIVKTATDGEMTSVISTQRQKESLQALGAGLFSAAELLQKSASPELVALEMKESLHRLQNVIGKNVGDDVMDQVFREFCIGK